MDDNLIIDLYWARSERAISETADKYGKYCHYIAYNILYNDEDSEECVNDTYLKVWDMIPPRRPERFPAFLGKITRNLALDRYKYNSREKRGNGQAPFVLDEFAECVPAVDNTEHIPDELALADCLDRFLAGLPGETRGVFLRRYWFFSSVKEIAADFSMSESKVKMILLRSRNKLKQLLMKEGIGL